MLHLYMCDVMLGGGVRAVMRSLPYMLPYMHVMRSLPYMHAVSQLLFSLMCCVGPGALHRVCYMFFYALVALLHGS